MSHKANSNASMPSGSDTGDAEEDGPFYFATEEAATEESDRNPLLNLTGASIRDSCPGDLGARGAPSIILPHQEASYVRHIALDIGGSLIKLVYFSPDPSEDGSAAATSAAHPKGGRMHFVKFETARIDDCLEFIEAKGLHRCTGKDGLRHEVRVKATGGGAVRFADTFKERLGLVLEREDEIQCAVGGCNFLLKTITHEAFTYSSEKGCQFVPCSSDSDLFPYLLVNIGSGVSIVKVDGEGQYERVSGSSVGGGTFWGLCRLLTGLHNFDDMLALSAKGNNSNVDMLVGDIYGGRDYSNIGLSATTIASSFGKVVGNDKELADYNPADVSMALCRMVAYNIGQLAYMNATRFNLKRVFFGGFFIRGHPYTMETISFAIRFWSKGEMNALFLRHEGFLGAVGAFLKVHPMLVHPTAAPLRPAMRAFSGSSSSKVRARFVERFSMGAPFAGGEVRGPVIKDMSDRVSWVEKFVRVGSAAQTEAQAQQQQQQQHSPADAAALERADSMPMSPTFYPTRMALHVGVLHYSPTQEPFPLLADPAHYVANTIDINKDEAEYQWLLKVLSDQVPTVVEKAIASEGGGDGPRRRGMAFGRAFAAHLAKLQADPGCYGQLGLSDLFEMREECLREFGFSDVYRLDKERENQVALQVLPDLLGELDQLGPMDRLLAIVQGILAANIFDWGAKACVELYTNGTILDIYRDARRKLSKRPWRVDDFDAFCARVYGAGHTAPQTQQEEGEVLAGSTTPAAATGITGGPGPKVAAGVSSQGLSQQQTPVGQQPAGASAGAAGGAGSKPPFQRVMVFVDNAGADVVLGMLPFVREMLRLGSEVVMVANSLPAINDITAPELRSLLSAAAEMCPIIRAALTAARKQQGSGSGGLGGAVPPYPGYRQRQPSHQDLSQLARSPPAAGDPLAQGGSSSSRQEVGSPPSSSLAGLTLGSGAPGEPSHNPPTGGAREQRLSSASTSSSLSFTAMAGGGCSPGPSFISSSGAPGEGVAGTPPTPPAAAAAGLDRTPRLYVVANGHGGPCLDLSRVPSALADATVGVDLLVIEGMGRAVHTNLYAQFKCDCLKLAMIKTERIAYKLFGGGLYDCMCRFQPAPPASTWSSGNGGTPARAGGSSSSSSGAGAAAGTWGGPAWQQQQHRTSSS